MRRITYILLCVFAVLATACDNEGMRSSVPPVYVRYSLDLVAEYPHFMPDNGFQALTFTEPRNMYDAVGYAGLLVWVSMEGKYCAADLCCPYCLDRETPVEIDGFYAVCPKCGEKYDLSYGYAFPTQGRTREHLRLYTTFIQGTKLIIRN